MKGKIVSAGFWLALVLVVAPVAIIMRAVWKVADWLSGRAGQRKGRQ